MNIRETPNVTNIVNWIKERRELWNDRVGRMTDVRFLGQKARDNRPEGKKSKIERATTDGEIVCLLVNVIINRRMVLRNRKCRRKKRLSYRRNLRL